jgi:hypothetical protein
MLRTGGREDHLVEGECETVSVINLRGESTQEWARHQLCRMGMGRRTLDDQDIWILKGRYGREADQDVRERAK